MSTPNQPTPPANQTPPATPSNPPTPPRTTQIPRNTPTTPDEFGAEFSQDGGRAIVTWWFENDTRASHVIISVEKMEKGVLEWEHRRMCDISHGIAVVDLPSSGRYIVKIFAVSGGEIADYVVFHQDDEVYKHSLPPTPVNTPVRHIDPAPEMTVWLSRSTAIDAPKSDFRNQPVGELAKLFEYTMGHRPETTFGYHCFAVFVGLPVILTLIGLRLGAFLFGRKPAPLFELLNANSLDEYDLPPERARFRVTMYGWNKPYIWHVSNKGRVRLLPVVPFEIACIVAICAGIASMFAGISGWFTNICLVALIFLVINYVALGKWDNRIIKDNTPIRVSITKWITRLRNVVSRRYH